jgi:5-methylcytosine-specific restriction protein A
VHRLQFAQPGPRQQGYDSEWEDVRATVLREEPFCRFCLAAGRHTAAEHVDHIKPLSQGGARLERSNLRPLCASCHGRRTAIDSLGWGKW